MSGRKHLVSSTYGGKKLRLDPVLTTDNFLVSRPGRLGHDSRRSSSMSLIEPLGSSGTPPGHLTRIFCERNSFDVV